MGEALLEVKEREQPSNRPNQNSARAGLILVVFSNAFLQGINSS